MSIKVGDKVTFKLNGQLMACVIVYADVGDPTRGKISCNAPLGQLLLGRTEGDVIRGKVPAGPVTVEIISVENAVES